MMCRMLLTSRERGARYEPAPIHLCLNMKGMYDLWQVAWMPSQYIQSEAKTIESFF